MVIQDWLLGVVEGVVIFLDVLENPLRDIQVLIYNNNGFASSIS